MSEIVYAPWTALPTVFVKKFLALGGWGADALDRGFNSTCTSCRPGLEGLDGGLGLALSASTPSTTSTLSAISNGVWDAFSPCFDVKVKQVVHLYRKRPCRSPQGSHRNRGLVSGQRFHCQILVHSENRSGGTSSQQCKKWADSARETFKIGAALCRLSCAF
eukprot:6482638-Amphidinium_carterae.1